jgi:hypothetical protein
MHWLGQGDSLSCLLFNLAPEKVIRDSGFQTRGTIFYKSILLLTFADDIDIIGRSEEDIRKSFIALKTVADALVLKISEGKTKYVIVKGNKKQTMIKSYIKVMDLSGYMDLYARGHWSVRTVTRHRQS